VIAVDTSVAVAAALPWHEAHAPVRTALPRGKTRLLAQVAVETYSVLTRLPPPQRVATAVARDYLKETFLLPSIALSPEGYDRLLELAVTESISGGAVYDALVAATAEEAGATLFTLDRRATETYRLLRIDYEVLG